MIRHIFDQDWTFYLQAETDPEVEYGFLKHQEASLFASRHFDSSSWQKIELPHDWGVELPFDRNADPSHGHRPISEQRGNFSDENGTPLRTKAYPIGWYRKNFVVGEDKRDRRFILAFEGVYRDCMVWVNGAYIDGHLSGYTGFSLDITDQIAFGESNSIAVRVDASQYEGWWYEGAGIYRHVWLYEAGPVHIPLEETYIRAFVSGEIAIHTKVSNQLEQSGVYGVEAAVTAPDGRKFSLGVEEVQPNPWEVLDVQLSGVISNPILWELENPQLYTLTLTIYREGIPLDEETTSFGFRDIVFDAENGCFLNGRHIEIQGVCVHQDFAGVGVALPDRITQYKIEKLKEMGVNAYRSSHHPPSPALLDACDRLGMLVMDEHRQTSSTPEGLRQLTALVKRDRNHPCVILWSIGNEEHQIQSNEFGERAAKTMIRTIRQLDDTRAVTYGGNNGADFEGINGVVDVRGINYIRLVGDVDAYHAAHPGQPIIGSEEASVVMARGIYKNDPQTGYVSAYDENTMSWGSTAEGWGKFYHARPYLCGAFVWTGFDYRGEPSPFVNQDSCSNFGIMDLCGFPKDVYYYYQSWWTAEPVLHLMPHWNHTPGEPVRVVVYTNCDAVELWLNQKKIGEQRVERDGCAHFATIFEPGELMAIGYQGGKEILRDICVTAEEPAVIRIQPDRNEVAADGDVAILTVQLEDAHGTPVPHADRLLYFRVQGGVPIGVGNGDPVSTEPEVFPDLVEDHPLGEWFLRQGGIVIPVSVETPCQEKPWGRQDLMEITEVEEGHPAFNDRKRLIWSVQSSPEECKEYTVSFQGEGGKAQLVFKKIYGEYEIRLNGTQIAAGKDHSTKHRDRDWSSCVLDVSLVKGENRLTVVCKSSTGRCGLHDGVYRRSTRRAVWSRSTFGGKCMLLVRSQQEPIHVEAFGQGLESGHAVIGIAQ